LYYNIGEYKSAIVALQNVIKDFPEVPQKEELDFLTLKSYYLLADNSIETKKLARYQETIEFSGYFKAEYPTSKYLSEARNIAEKAENGVRKITKQQNNIQ